MVVCHYGEPRPVRETAFGDPSSHRLSHPAEFGIRTTLEPIAALKLQRDVVGPALRALDKTVVKSGHGSWGIYTKNSYTAETAEIGEKIQEKLLLRSAISALWAVGKVRPCSLQPVGSM
jgi:hypothetical protein